MGNMVPFTGKYIAVLYRQELKAINHTMRQYGLGYSCYNFLLYISTYEGCSQKLLCQHMNLDEAMATRTLTKLEKQGFILRQKDKNSPRTLSLSLTDKGCELIPVIRSALSDWWSGLTGSMGKEESQIFIEQLKTMAEHALAQGQTVTDRSNQKGKDT